MIKVAGSPCNALAERAETQDILFAVVGMSSCLAAVVRAPVTSILIVFEMTHEFVLVPPLMVCRCALSDVKHLGGGSVINIGSGGYRAHLFAGNGAWGY